MVHGLKMPLSFPRQTIQRNHTVGEQIVAKPLAAVIVISRHAGRQVDHTERLIDAHGRPYIGITVHFPAVLLPTVDTILTLARHGVEGP